VAPWFLQTEVERRPSPRPGCARQRAGGRCRACRRRGDHTGRQGRPDRPPADGRIAIYDYKSGKPPTEKEERSFSKQLWLEAAMAADGAFGDDGPLETARIAYIGLGRPPRSGAMTPRAIRSSAEIRVPRLLAHYLDPHPASRPRRAVKNTRWRGDYDQLARYGEWDETSPSSAARSGRRHHDRSDERRHACSGHGGHAGCLDLAFRECGSGKTRVLTDRVARLLLDEVPPERILCLTYTKAAAMEMQNRLFSRLGAGR
jgi:hypothetical protein